MKRLLLGSALIVTTCTDIHYMIGRHGVAIIILGILAFYFLCVHCFVRHENKMNAQAKKREANKPIELDITEKYYHEGIEQIAHLCKN